VRDACPSARQRKAKIWQTAPSAAPLPAGSELAEFFVRAQGASRKGGEQGKELLRKRLAG
jgi:hypothetical protein